MTSLSGEGEWHRPTLIGGGWLIKLNFVLPTRLDVEDLGLLLDE